MHRYSVLMCVTLFMDGISYAKTPLSLSIYIYIYYLSHPLPTPFLSVAEKRQRKRKGCMECAGCKREDCGTCRNCKDMVKFGGPGRKSKSKGMFLQ